MTQEQINSLFAEPATKSCTWTEDADGNWNTGCKEIHVLIVGTPPENGYVFCPYCGGKIEEENAAGQDRREATYHESEEPDDRQERCDSCGETSHCLMNGLCPMCYELNGGTHD